MGTLYFFLNHTSSLELCQIMVGSQGSSGFYTDLWSSCQLKCVLSLKQKGTNQTGIIIINETNIRVSSSPLVLFISFYSILPGRIHLNKDACFKSLLCFEHNASRSPCGGLFVAAVPVAAADLQTLSHSQLQALHHLEARLVERVLCGEILEM